MREYPGLRRIFLALHPQPRRGACDPETTSCLRHRLAMLSRALLDPGHGYTDPDLLDYVQRFHALLAGGESSTAEMATWRWPTSPRPGARATSSPRIHFADTVIDYRDDNRQLWQFIEEGDEEEFFDERKLGTRRGIHAACRRAATRNGTTAARPTGRTGSASTRACTPAAKPATSTLLQKHAALAKRSSVCSTCSSRRTRCACAIRKRAANSTSTSPSAR
jgi:nitric oxide reductase NorD protein